MGSEDADGFAVQRALLSHDRVQSEHVPGLDLVGLGVLLYEAQSGQAVQDFPDGAGLGLGQVAAALFGGQILPS